jgi:hypothetical protein
MQRSFVVAVIATFFLGACSLDESIITTGMRSDDNFDYFIEGDMAIALPLRENGFLAAGESGPSALFLNFEGLTLHSEGWRQDNAQSDSSFISDVERTIPAFDSQYWPGSRDEVIAQIRDGVRDDFANYELLVTTTRPLSGSYTMIVVGGRPSDIGRSGNLLGVAPFDSTNWNANDVGFVFSERAGESGYLPQYLAHVISHEFAHTLGLNHILRDGDIMRPSACHCAQSWGAGVVVGTSSEVQDDAALLHNVLPLAGQSPLGRINSIDALGHIRGWACDPDEPEMSVELRLSIEDMDGTLTFDLSLLADHSSGAPVFGKCGGGNAHRFAADIPLTFCGQAVRAHALNLGDTGGSATELQASPKNMPACLITEDPPEPL